MKRAMNNSLLAQSNVYQNVQHGHGNSNYKNMKRAMSNPYSHTKMIFGEFHMANEKQIINI